VRVWRTGVGIDRRGNLMFVAADDQTVISLARILQDAGAVRAMEFDINPEWHTHTGVAGRRAGYLDDPDGIDLMPPYSYADRNISTRRHRLH
jgi:hypothetical protein